MIAAGTEIEGYRIEGFLGRGGMGEVYEARQLSLNRTVALKILHSGLGADDEFRARFRREGELQAAIEHPNIVAVYEAGALDDGLFLAMRLVRGHNLKQLLAAGELDAERTLRLLGPVADALDTAHAAGLIHRDVKPQNILVGAGDHPYLADFGLTRTGEDTGYTRTGQFVGSIDYIAPEQVRGEPAGPASDTYALAGVLFECLAGHPPFPRPSDAAVLYAHVNDPPPSVTADRPDLPPAIDGVIATGLAKEPEDRMPSASALIGDAARALGSDPTVAHSRPQPIPPAAHGHGTRATPATAGADRPTPAAAEAGSARAKRRPGRWLVPGAAAIAVLAAAAFLAGRSGETAAAPEPLTASASSADVALRAPAGWTRTPSASAAEIPGLGLSSAVALTPDGPPAAGQQAGVTRAAGSTLLPAALRKRLAAPLPRAARVRLGRLEALRYRGIRVRGFDRTLTLYAVPATTGVATVACYAPPQDAAGFAPRCERVALTLRLVRGASYPLGPGAATAAAISRSMSSLNRSRARERRALRRAGTQAGQAQAADRLARAYSAAARRLRAVNASPAITPTVRSAAQAMDAAGRASGRLADAVRADDGASYGDAASQLKSADSDIARRLARLRAAGYKVT